MKRSRYFLVMYMGDNNNVVTHGDRTFEVTNGGFLKQSVIRDMLKKENNLSNVVILNIIELKRSDYKHWIADDSDR